MPMTFSEKGSDNSKFLAPSGSHIALCNMVVYLGIQARSAYPDPKPQVLISWELPYEIVEWEVEGKKFKGPKTVAKTYTASMGKKANLRKDLESWRGKAFSEGEAGSFDVGKILGQGCMLNIVHKVGDDRTYANVVGISGVPKGTTLPGFHTKPVYYGEDDKTLYDDLPQWVRTKIDAQIIPEAKPVVESPFDNQAIEDDEAVPF